MFHSFLFYAACILINFLYFSNILKSPTELNLQISPFHSFHPLPISPVLLEQEIDRLNEECLDLEDQVSALKVEVKEAWGSYKNAQERAALREAELQDEIRQVCFFLL